MSAGIQTASRAVAAPSHGVPRRLALLGTLYVSQAIPLGFFIEAVPAIGRDVGLSLREIGWIQVLAAPFLLKFLWAPFVDRFGSRRGHYRSWLVPLQSAAVAVVVALALWRPGVPAAWLLAGGGLFLLLAATQDIATDGLAVRLLSREERGAGNGIQVGGYYLGQILGGGLMLILFGSLGWTAALLAMAALLVLPVPQLLGFREPPPVPRDRPPGFGALARFLRRPGVGIWVAVLVVYRAGDAMALTMAKPLLIDLGWPLARVGLLVGVGNSIAALSGALAGGALVGRVGRRRSLVAFALLHAAALAGFALPAAGLDRAAVVVAVSMAAAFAGGMATAALYTCMMDRASAPTAGTDFTLQQSLAAIGPIGGAALSGMSAAALGYAPHFLLAGCAALLAATLSRLLPADPPPSRAPGADPR